MGDKDYGAIPVPTDDPAALYQSVLALKTAFDVMTGKTRNANASFVTSQSFEESVASLAALQTSLTAVQALANSSIQQGKHTIWVPAVAMAARTTNGSAIGSTELASNKNMLKTLDFSTSIQQFAQFEIAMPKNWNEGTVTFQPVWSHPAATLYGVVWALQAVATSDDDALDVAFGTEQTSSDTGGTTNDRYIGPESSAITVNGSPAAGDVVQFQIKRNVSAGGDTLDAVARLHGIKLYYTVNAATDV